MHAAFTRRAVIALSLIAMFALGVLAQRSGLFDQIAKYRSDIIYLSQQHMKLVAISGGLAILVGVPFGLWLSRPRMRGMAESLMQALNIGSTIPTLAVLALAMSFLGIGTVPAIFALWVASLLPIVRNTYAGMLGVPAYLVEASTGMGMR
ncbi:MAG: ABC transporter permease, partial [Burkholderiaceae bacterium]|nr:ABC transporter permease [Burkholderiaceae bacterium]